MTVTFIWAFLAVIGTALASINLVSALMDRRAVRAMEPWPGRNMTLRAAREAFWRCLTQYCVMLGYDALAIVALWWPGRGWGGYVIAGTLFLLLGLGVNDSWRRFSSRRKMRQEAVKQRAGEIAERRARSKGE